MQKLTWCLFADDRVRMRFGKHCACTGVPDEQYSTPDNLAFSGAPICPECGEDYNYECTEILQ